MTKTVTNRFTYGILVRINREHQNINLSTLSELSGISVSQLSKIERGIETATNDTLSYIFEALDIDYDFLNNEIENISYLFKNLYNCIYYFEPKENAKKILDEMNEKYLSEFITVEILLANLMYYLTYEINLNRIERYFDILLKLVEYLSLYQKQIFYDYCGVYYKVLRRIDKAIYYFQLSIDINNNNMVTAMANYHLGIVYRKKHQILKSYGCIQNSKNIFSLTNNFRRNVMADLVISNLHSSNGEYNEALELLDVCLNSYKRLNAPLDEISTIYFNIIWNNILKENYIEAKRVLDSLDKEILEILNTNLVFIIYQIVLLIEFNMYKEAFELCKPIRMNYNEKDIDHNFIMYYYYLIKDNKSKRIKYLNQIKKLILQDSSYIELRFLFKLLNKESSTNNQLTEFKDLLMDYIFNTFDD